MQQKYLKTKIKSDKLKINTKVYENGISNVFVYH